MSSLVTHVVVYWQLVHPTVIHPTRNLTWAAASNLSWYSFAFLNMLTVNFYIPRNGCYKSRWHTFTREFFILSVGKIKKFVSSHRLKNKIHLLVLNRYLRKIQEHWAMTSHHKSPWWSQDTRDERRHLKQLLLIWVEVSATGKETVKHRIN